MYFYAALCLICLVLMTKWLPASLDNIQNEDESESSKQRRTAEERELLAGCNKIDVSEIGLMTVIGDRVCFFACLQCFMAMCSIEYYVGYLSLHLKEEFGVLDS